MADNKWWNLDEGLTEGYSSIPHTLLCLLMDSKALTISEVNVLACVVRQTFGILGRQAVRASAKQIATATNLHDKQVQKALRSLEKKGHITMERERGGASLIRLTFKEIRPKEEPKRSRKNAGASRRPAGQPIQEVTEDPELVAHRKRRLKEMLRVTEDPEFLAAREQRNTAILGPGTTEDLPTAEPRPPKKKIVW